MRRLVEWIKANKLVVVLIAVVGCLVWRDGGVDPIRPLQMMTKSVSVGRGGYGMADGVAMNMMAPSAEMAEDFSMPVPPMPEPDVAPTQGDERLVIRDTNMSLVVDEVKDTITKIEQKAAALGGYLVNSNLNVPEGAASGSITVRVPADKRSEALEAFRGYGVRVVSENVNGRDVTDQYTDLQERMEILEKTKIKFEAILDEAVRVQDLLQVQRELVSLQQQIDNLKGRQKYLEQSANLTKVTIYLSTDELALPYTPDQVWRPKVVLKEAVRSLIKTVRSGGSALIWAAVYAPIWLPVAGLVWFFGLRKKRQV